MEEQELDEVACGLTLLIRQGTDRSPPICCSQEVIKKNQARML